jgi:hypothetical protein
VTDGRDLLTVGLRDATSRACDFQLQFNLCDILSAEPCDPVESAVSESAPTALGAVWRVISSRIGCKASAPS